MWPEVQWYWDSFSTLSTDRQIGMAEGPIPFSAIDRYALRYGIDDTDEFERFLNVIMAMDGEFRAKRRESPQTVDPKQRAIVEPTDAKGLSGLLSRLGAAAAKRGLVRKTKIASQGEAED